MKELKKNARAVLCVVLAMFAALGGYFFYAVYSYGSRWFTTPYNTRLNAAKNLLAKSAYSVAEIAELCGYQDAFYFSRVFKKKLGLSPSEFREENVGGTPEHWENVGDAAFLRKAPPQTPPGKHIDPRN